MVWKEQSILDSNNEAKTIAYYLSHYDTQWITFAISIFVLIFSTIDHPAEVNVQLPTFFRSEILNLILDHNHKTSMFVSVLALGFLHKLVVVLHCQKSRQSLFIEKCKSLIRKPPLKRFIWLISTVDANNFFVKDILVVVFYCILWIYIMY